MVKRQEGTGHESSILNIKEPQLRMEPYQLPSSNSDLYIFAANTLLVPTATFFTLMGKARAGSYTSQSWLPWLQS